MTNATNNTFANYFKTLSAAEIAELDALLAAGELTRGEYDALYTETICGRANDMVMVS